MSRSAAPGYKGYTYQRARLLHLIFCEYYSPNDEQVNSISFCEENLEDIDIYITNNGNTEIHLYQEKYLNVNDNESFNKDSGLTKVIISHYNNKEITNINYEVVTLSGNISCCNKLNNFIKLINDDTNNHLIGKFIILNFCNSKLFSTQTYETNITDIIHNDLLTADITKMINNQINFTQEDKTGNTNRYKLNQFCHYCNDENNISELIIYLQKIKVKISKNMTFDDIHTETITKLKNILPEFNNECIKMSNEYNDFYCETLYGLFEMIIVKNLFQTNDKMTIKQLIDIVKDKIKNSTTCDDKLTLVIYTINYFIRGEKYNEIINRLFKNDSLIRFMLKHQITITKFIRNLDKEHIDNNPNIGDIIRKIIYDICLLKKYGFLDDAKLLGFLHRTHKNIKFTGMKYASLEAIDKLMLIKDPPN